MVIPFGAESIYRWGGICNTSRPGDVWEFKKDVDGTQFYVKVKIVQENGEDILKCLGFHEDDFA